MHTIRDKYVCDRAHREARYNDKGRPISLDVMPDICGTLNTASSDCLDTRKSLMNWWRYPEYSLSESIHERIFGDGTIWNDLAVSGNWKRVEKTLYCLRSFESAHLRTTYTLPLIAASFVQLTQTLYYGGTITEVPFTIWLYQTHEEGRGSDNQKHSVGLSAPRKAGYPALVHLRIGRLVL